KNGDKILRKARTRFDAPWIKLAYVAYFQTKFDKRVDWAPDTICEQCHRKLYMWYNGKQKSQLFLSPVCWLKPLNHDFQCFFFYTKIALYKSHNRDNIERYHFLSDKINSSASPPASLIDLDDVLEYIRMLLEKSSKLGSDSG